MTKQLIFVDDSGDPGFKEGSSSNFVMAAAVFIDPKVAAALSQRLSDYRRSLGWRDDYEFKFAKIRKDIIIELLKIAVLYDFKIYAVYVNKSGFRYASSIIDKEKLYEWTIKELLATIPMTEAKIEIDGRSSKQNMRRTATYLRRELGKNGKKQLKIKFEDSAKDNLIQVADLIAGSINRSLNTEKTDSKIYIDIIKEKIINLRRLDQR